MEYTAEQIAGFLNGKIEGNPAARVNDVSKIEEGKPGTLAFLSNPKYQKYIYDTQATIVLVNEDFVLDKDVNATLIRVKDAYEAFASLLDLYEQSKPKKTGVSPNASISGSAITGENLYAGDFVYIGDDAKIGNNVRLYPQVFIGDKVTIGDNTILYPGVRVLDGCQVGKNCIIHAGTVIGSDGFGFALEQNRSSRRKVPQLGNVVIGNDVEIGSNVCIDRATMGSTRIGNRVKMDNLIQIAHNVEIGDDSVVVAQAGVAGSTKVGKNVILAAQAGLVGHITIGDGAIIAAQAGVAHNIREKEIVLGSPAFDIREFRKSAAIFKRLPEIRNTLIQLEKDVKEMKHRNNPDGSAGRRKR
jgi:UDP-3-O-[3-hydroxymyristoyl] glucosamine N-acyltransferase